jgi:uncharacterized protein
MANEIYINLPIKNLEKSKQFYSNLGFKFNPQFSDEKSACVIIGKNIFAMLMEEDRFKTFLPGKNIIDAKKNTEALIAIDEESRAKVDEMLKNVLISGGKEFRKAQDYGWMYLRAFEDLDGHIWEVGFMDKSKMPEEMKNKKNEENEK